MTNYNINYQVGQKRWDCAYNQGQNIAAQKNSLSNDDTIQFAKNNSSDDIMAFAKGYYDTAFNGATSISKDQVNNLFPNSKESQISIFGKDIDKRHKFSTAAELMDINKDNNIDVYEYAALLKMEQNKATPQDLFDKAVNLDWSSPEAGTNNPKEFKDNYNNFKSEYGSSIAPKAEGNETVKEEKKGFFQRIKDWFTGD